MDELSPLFHDIEFNERFRGYDVEEVDAYVDRVAKAAALVQGRIAELQDRVAAAEAQPRTVVASPPPTAPIDEFEDVRLSRVLVLAQRTADAAIEEAEAEAAGMRAEAEAAAMRIRREADDHASLVLAEAETDRRRLLTEAEEAAAGAVAIEQERAAAELAELDQYRQSLTDDIAILEEHLAEIRLSVSASLSTLTDLLEAPEAFRAAEAPATSGVEIPGGLSDGVPSAASFADAEEEATVSEVVIEPIGDVSIGESVSDEASATGSSRESVAAIEDPPTIDSAENGAAPGAADDAMAKVVQECSSERTTEAGIEVHAAASSDDRNEAADGGIESIADESAPVVDLTAAATAPVPVVGDRMVELVADAPANDLASGDAATALAPPRLVTAEDIEEVDSQPWIEELESDVAVTAPLAEPSDLLFAPESVPAGSNDRFLDELRDVVGSGEPQEFGEDALAAFFDDSERDDSRGWFNRRR